MTKQPDENFKRLKFPHDENITFEPNSCQAVAVFPAHYSASVSLERVVEWQQHFSRMQNYQQGFLLETSSTTLQL